MGPCLLWLMCCGTALGEEAEHTFHSFPPALVYEADRFLGRTGEPIKLNKDPHTLTLRQENHARLDVQLLGQDLAGGRQPKKGEFELEPDNALVGLRDSLMYRPGRSSAIALVVLLLLAAARRMLSSHRRHQVLLGMVSSEGGEHRSLIMEQVGEYRVVSLLGQGGMAEVYLAVPRQTLAMESAVALKVLNREMRDRSELAERFTREVTISQELSHPGIVQIHGWGWHNGRMYLAMEYLEGRELRQLLPELAKDRQTLKDVLSQLFQAVDYAHQRGVAHRDLKPENVMVTEAGRVKVMDFGLARAVDSQTLTQAGSSMGTPRYIAPETVAGQTGDDRADQYALGIMAFEMLVGRAPFESDEVLYLLYCHGNVEPPAPSSLADLPVALDAPILRMLAKDPRARFRTVEEARVQLLAALEKP